MKQTVAIERIAANQRGSLARPIPMRVKPSISASSRFHNRTAMARGMRNELPSTSPAITTPIAMIDIPTLRDVWATAPYLHDGSAATLADAVTAHKGITINVTDLANLVQYLEEIDGAEPAAK